MRFIKVFVVTLAASLLFVFFGGGQLFSLAEHPYAAAAAFALAAAGVISAFMAQDDRIERLEERVKELEKDRGGE